MGAAVVRALAAVSGDLTGLVAVLVIMARHGNRDGNNLVPNVLVSKEVGEAEEEACEKSHAAA